MPEAKPLRNLPYEGALPAPYQGVSLTVNFDAVQFYFEYRGSIADLVGCGALPERLTKMQRKGVRIVDDEGDNILRQLRGGNARVLRYKALERASQMPGFEPWMPTAAEIGVRQANERRRRAERERLLGEMERTSPVLGPEAWRTKRLEFLHMARLAADAADPLPHMSRLEDGYAVSEADRRAYKDRAQALLAELAGMLSKLRIVRIDEAEVPLDVQRDVNALLGRLGRRSP